jgi:predicted dehydrogenase
MPCVAIIGVAHPHVEYVLEELKRSDRKDYTLLGVQDSDVELAHHYAAPFGAPVFAQVNEILAERPDVAVIAGRYAERGTEAAAALRAGAHIIADKPLCTSLEQLNEVEQAVRVSGRSVTLLLEKRGYPETLAAHEFIQTGGLGEIVGITSVGPHKLNPNTRPEWFFRRDEYGGIIGDLAVHDLDTALLFAPAQSAQVRGWVRAVAPNGFAHYGVASVITPTTVISAEVSWLTPQASDVHGDYRMRVVGTRGTLEIFWARGRVEVVTDDRVAHDLTLPPRRRPAQDALDTIAGGAPDPKSTDDALAVTRLALLAQDSADHAGDLRTWSR